MSKKKNLKGWWLIQLSLLLALYLQALPMPSFLLYVRPDWLSLVLIFWALNLPNRVGPGHGLVWGLLLDLIEGTLLGHNALVLSSLVFVSNIFYQRILMSSPFKQSLLILLLLAACNLLSQWLQVMFGSLYSWGHLVTPTLVSAILWYWLYLILQSLKRKYVNDQA